MNATINEKPSIWVRSPFVRFVRWLFTPRTLGRMFFALLTLATLVALFYAEEYWRGKRTWEQYQAGMVSRGIRLDWEAYIPPPVPNAQNFALTPFLTPMLDYVPGTQQRRDTNAYAQMQARCNSPYELAESRGFDLGRSHNISWWEKGEQTDWLAVLGTNDVSAARRKDLTNTVSSIQRPTTSEAAATEVLDMIGQTVDPVLAELRAASQREQCRFNLAYDYTPLFAIELPHLSKVKTMVQVLSWRAGPQCLGRTNEAFADLKLGLYLTDTVKAEPFLISYLVRNACRALLLQPIYDGLSRHQWTEVQLQQLMAVLLKDDYLQDLEDTLMAERAGGARIVEQLRTTARGYHLDDMLENLGQNKIVHTISPLGWLYLEQVNLCRGYDRSMAPFEDWRAGRIDTRAFIAAVDQAEKRYSEPNYFWNHRTLEFMMLPAMGKAYAKGMNAQMQQLLCVTACGLERYYLAHGTYPDNLEALVPSLIPQLPKDIMSGKPLIYRRESPAAFLLYSVGQNLVDDGGSVVMIKGNRINPQAGDWVWRQPGK